MNKKLASEENDKCIFSLNYDLKAISDVLRHTGMSYPGTWQRPSDLAQLVSVNAELNGNPSSSPVTEVTSNINTLEWNTLLTLESPDGDEITSFKIDFIELKVLDHSFPDLPDSGAFPNRYPSKDDLREIFQIPDQSNNIRVAPNGVIFLTKDGEDSNVFSINLQQPHVTCTLEFSVKFSMKVELRGVSAYYFFGKIDPLVKITSAN